MRFIFLSVVLFLSGCASNSVKSASVQPQNANRLPATIGEFAECSGYTADGRSLHLYSNSGFTNLSSGQTVSVAGIEIASVATSSATLKTSNIVLGIVKNDEPAKGSGYNDLITSLQTIDGILNDGRIQFPVKLNCENHYRGKY